MQTIRALCGLMLACSTIMSALPTTAAPGEGALYFTNTVSQAPTVGTCTGVRYEMNPLPPAAASVQKAYADVSNLAQTCRTHFDHVATETFRMSGKLKLEIYWACDAPTAVQEIRTRIFLDDQELSLASHVPTTPDTCTGATTVNHATIEHDSKNSQVAQGQTLTVAAAFFAVLSGPPGQPAGQIVFFATGLPGSASGLVGAGLPTPGGTTPTTTLTSKVFQTLTGPQAHINKTFASATTQVQQYNWTSTLTELDLAFSASPTNGTVGALVKDGAGKTLYDKVLTAQGNDMMAVSGAAGNYSFTLTLTGFAGSVDLLARAKGTQPTGGPTGTAPTPTGTGGPGSTGSPTASGSPTGTGDPTGAAGGGGDNDTPAVGAWALLSLLAMAVAVQRRRT